MSALPLHLQRVLDVDRSFHAQAICRQPTSETPKLAWTAERKKTYHVGSQRYTGEKLIELASMVCQHCPVQWQCARAAIEGGEPVGTWSAPINDIRWLGSRRDWERVLDHAQAEGVDVQTTIRRLRARMT